MDGFDAMELGAAYALYGYQEDKTREAIMAQGTQTQAAPVVNVFTGEDRPDVPHVNALQYNTTPPLDGWDDFVGQDEIKAQLQVHIASALARDAALPHVLLASGRAGVGKTQLARLIAKQMNAQIVELVPPFNIYTLVEAAETLWPGGILLIDEIHKLAERGKAGAEILLKIMEENVAFLPNGRVVELCDITIIGATTDRDMLPEPVIDRFKIKPEFGPYSRVELAEIAIKFAVRHDCLEAMDPNLAMGIARACRETPRITEELVLAARDLTFARGYGPTIEELLAFLRMQPDGLTQAHVTYLTTMLQFFGKPNPKTGQVEYVAGEATMQSMLRETKQGIGRLERYLLETGLIDRTPGGRRLTAAGIARARQLVSGALT